MPTITPSTLDINLMNQWNNTSDPVYASITGHDINRNNALCFIEADGSTLYYPSQADIHSPPQPLANCGILLNPQGQPAKSITVPKLATARIYFSIGHALNFYVNLDINKNLALVEPSVSNPTADPADPKTNNYTTQWGFCEFTYNDQELYANISYVDFIGLPIALDLTTQSSSTPQKVVGLAANGLTTIDTALQNQTNADKQPWSSLSVKSNGNLLRVLSPNSLIKFPNPPSPPYFSGYFEQTVQQVWKSYTASNPLTINTQDPTWGNVNGYVDSSSQLLTFTSSTLPSSPCTFAAPTTANIFNCSETPFDPANNDKGNISARIAAAFNRGTLLMSNTQPNGVQENAFNTVSPCNHYSRILHVANLDGLGYAFPYDDVTPNGGQGLSGKVEASDPNVFTVTIGGAQNGNH